MESTYATLECAPTVDPLETQVDPHFSEPATPNEQTKFITFVIGDSNYCINAASVAEITDPVPHSYIPNAPAALTGLAPYRGEMVAVVSVHRDRPALTKPTTARPKLLVLHECEFPARAGFEIDRLLDVVSIPADQMHETGRDPGTMRANDRSFHLISADEVYSLLRPPEK